MIPTPSRALLGAGAALALLSGITSLWTGIAGLRQRPGAGCRACRAAGRTEMKSPRSLLAAGGFLL